MNKIEPGQSGFADEKPSSERLDTQQDQVTLTGKQQVLKLIQPVGRGHLVRKHAVSPETLQPKLEEMLRSIQTDKGEREAKEALEEAQEAKKAKFSLYSFNPGNQPTAAAMASPAVTEKVPDLQDAKTLSLRIAHQILEFAHSAAKEKHLEGNPSVWVSKNTEGNVEIELMGYLIAGGSFKRVYDSPILVLKLDTREKEVQPGVMVQFSAEHQKNVTEGIEIIKNFLSAYPEGERKHLRFAGMLSHLDRKHPRIGLIHARDIKMMGNLAETRQPLSLESKKQIFADVARTLLALHKSGIVHGDIKEGNILVREESNKARGYLADLDGVQNILVPGELLGKHLTIGYFPQLSFGTHFTDAYAMAVTANNIFGKGSDNPYRTEVDAVMKANNKLGTWEGRDAVLQKIGSQDIHEKIAALNELNRVFPEFNNLLVKMIEY